MKCSSKDENGNTYANCEAYVTLVQQGQSTHLYGCELRIRPAILDKVSVEVLNITDQNFQLRGVKFTSNLQPGESQVQVVAQRPDKIVEPTVVRALVRVAGVTKIKE